MFSPILIPISLLIMNMNDACLIREKKLEKKKPIHMLILSVLKIQNDSRNIMYLHEFFIIENL
jgi:hypothetical protein